MGADEGPSSKNVQSADFNSVGVANDIATVLSSDEEHEDDSLLRLAQQAQHRKLSQRDFAIEHESHPELEIDEIQEDHEDINMDLEENTSHGNVVFETEQYVDDSSDDDEEDESESDEEDGEEEDEEEEEEEEDEEETLYDMLPELGSRETTDFLRRLIGVGEGVDNNNRDEHFVNNRTESENAGNRDNERISGGDADTEQEEPRAGFLRAFGELSNARNETSGGPVPSNFMAVMQRLMGDGMMFGSGGGFGSSMGSESSEIESLINNLEQRSDTYIVLESLNQLSERLLMMNGLTAERLIPANKLAKSIIQIMEDPKLAEELELHLVACRCLYNFLEVNQDFIHDALNNNAIPALCNKLMEITYIDLTEQALQTLEMISRDPISHNSIISNQGLSACLQYLDFLTVHAQRKCLSIVSNSCTNISIANHGRVKEAFHSITEVVRSHTDSNVVENAWISVSRIINSFKNNPELLDELFDGREDFLKELTEVIILSSNKSLNTSSSSNSNSNSSSGSNSNTKPSSNSSKVAVSFASCLSLIKSLIILASVSVNISQTLIVYCRIDKVIVQLLSKYEKTRSNIDQECASLSVQALMAAPKDLVANFLTLIGYLLPVTYLPHDSLFNFNSRIEESPEKEKINERRRSLCLEIIPQEYQQFVNNVWPVVIMSFQASMDFEIRRKSFTDLYRMVHSLSGDELVSVDSKEPIGTLIASVVTQYKESVLTEMKEMKPPSTGSWVSSQSGSKNDSRNRIPESRSNEALSSSSLVSSAVAEDENMSESGNDNEDEMDAEGEDEEEDEEDEDDEDEDDEDEEEEDEEREEDDDDDEQAIGFGDNYHPRKETLYIKNALPTILLYCSLKIMEILILKNTQVFATKFEKEGLMLDIDQILTEFKSWGIKPDAQVNPGEQQQTPRRYISMSAYSNKYIDMEITKDYVMNTLSANDSYSKIAQAASNIHQLYTNFTSVNDLSLSKHMKDLKELSSVLSDPENYKTFGFTEWSTIWQKLKTILDSNLSGRSSSSYSGVSSFELLSSGLIGLLANLFLEDNLREHDLELTDMYKSFVSLLFGDDYDAVTTLIHKLQEALTRAESFDIISAGASGPANSHSAYARDASRTSLMANQIKLRLKTEDDGNEVLAKSLQNMVLSVHAIATFKSVQTFIQQRLRFMEEFTKPLERGVLHDNVDASDSLVDQKSKHGDYNIEFLINGEVIPIETTIYGAIHRAVQKDKHTNHPQSNKIWGDVHLVTFRKVSAEVSNDSQINQYNFTYDEHELDGYDKSIVDVLKLLEALFKMNTLVVDSGIGKGIPTKEFTNWKLAVKLNRQLEEPLVVASGTLPDWSLHLTKHFAFIFPLETRVFFLQSTSFGYSRLIYHWQLRGEQSLENNSEGSQNSRNLRPQLGRPTRHKVRISRNMMLQSAIKVLELYGSTPGILEIEYFDEAGSGLGPTLEFYATVSKEFIRKKLKLWRDQSLSNFGSKKGLELNDPYIINSNGLFPAPMDRTQILSDNGKKILYFYSSLGKFVARALLDSRIIDFNFNPIFLKLIQFLNRKTLQAHTTPKQSRKFATLSNLHLVDPELARSLEHLQKYIKVYERTPASQKRDLRIDDATIEDLGLYFVLPGYPNYELIPNGREVQVDHTNLEAYIHKVVDATLFTGVISQTKAFMEGFSKVFPINSLIIFSYKELVELFGNAEEDWSFDALSSAINANHGYNKESEGIKNLISVLVEFDKEEKRQFLQFLTGSPRLPIGGFKSLRPELTVVRKMAEDGLKDDDYLPSVMTCANYLKLPNYSSKDVMKRKLLQAISEGAGAFLLS